MFSLLLLNKMSLFLSYLLIYIRNISKFVKFLLLRDELCGIGVLVLLRFKGSSYSWERRGVWSFFDILRKINLSGFIFVFGFGEVFCCYSSDFFKYK